jgi:hypothetical protein
VERIVVRPTGPYGPVEFDVYGQLAGLIRLSGPVLSAEPPVPATGSMGAMVAGARNNLNLLFNAPRLEAPLW